jgi:hypothetical protein
MMRQLLGPAPLVGLSMLVLTTLAVLATFKITPQIPPWLAYAAPSAMVLVANAYVLIIVLRTWRRVGGVNATSFRLMPRRYRESDALMKEMEDRRDNLVVIAAGCAEPMQAFLRTNPGLPSRFTMTINFPSYGREELVRIFHGLAEAERLQVDPEGEPALLQYFDKARTRPHFANARTARTLLERAREAQALRLGPILALGAADLTIPKWDDIETATWRAA